MTSLMDVMFLVLVFFIYSIFDMAVHKGVQVNLPKAAGALERGERIVVTLRADNSLQLNGIDCPRDNLVEKVRVLANVEGGAPVLISADRQAELGVGIELLSDLQAVGVEKVSFQVDGKR